MAFRWAAIAEHWASQGHQVHVICGWQPGLARNEKLNNVYVHRVGGSITEVLRSKLIDTSTSVNLGTNSAQTSSSLIKTLAKWVYDRTWKKVYWPDRMCLWYIPAFQKAKEIILDNSCTHLITVSDPFTPHLVGLNLKKILSSLPWVVDISDPFSFASYRPLNNHSLYKNLNFNLEKNIFLKANAIAVTTKATLDKYTELFPTMADKFSVISQLVPELPNLPIEDPALEKADKINLVFVGTLYSQIRRPEFLLSLFQQLLKTPLMEKLELHFYGSIGDCNKYFLPYQHLINKKIFTHGIVSREQAFQEMLKADILVNISNDTPYELPSKVVEYASLGKPVLNFAQNDRDCSTAFFKMYTGALCLIENEWTSASAPQIDKLVEFIQRPPRLEKSQLQELLSCYRLDEISKAYENLLINVNSC
ncbi:glycosyltransferase [Ancylothrix sp. D3o]|uniref:glycosyltransferase n=1 Tax=Ancylothrix sp. D3o TaxID=2953691 RepID=UPI0021BB5E02|nr:glycosyltransferase [Ancylothrix sp. D3o]